MSTVKMYSVILYIKHEPTLDAVNVNVIEFAPDKETAVRQATASIRKAEFASGTRGFTVENSQVLEVSREELERGATEVLGWHPPSA